MRFPCVGFKTINFPNLRPRLALLGSLGGHGCSEYIAYANSSQHFLVELIVCCAFLFVAAKADICNV